MNTLHASLLLTASLALSLGLAAVHANEEASIALPTVPELRQQIQSAKATLSGGKFSPLQREEAARAIARIETRLQGSDRYSVLSQAEQVDMVNDVSLLHGLLANAEDERMVCRREKPVGSNRISSVCKSAAEWERLRAKSRTNLEDSINRACTNVGCT